MGTNVFDYCQVSEDIAHLLGVIGQPVRIQILAVLREQEACVCHLEAALGLRQASISQHLIVLRSAGIVSAQRSGRNIFYRLEKPGLYSLIEQFALLTGSELGPLRALAARPVLKCPCPQCAPVTQVGISCGEIHRS
jgi:ArsR family transcriptional regulator